MRAGLLRHRVSLQSKSVAKNTHGEDIESWSTDKTVWASVEHLRGVEKENAGKYKATCTHRIVTRGVADISPDQRFLWGTRVFGIVRVNDLFERDITLVSYCEEVLT